METINDRIDMLIKALGFSSVSQFDIALNKARGTTWKITGTLQQKPGFEYLETIKKIFPQVNGDWLLSGDDEMFHPDKMKREYIQTLEQKIEALERQNRRYETMIDMAAQRQEHKIAANFQPLSEGTRVREIYPLYSNLLKKTA